MQNDSSNMKTSEKSENLEHENLDNELVILPLDEIDDLFLLTVKVKC